MANYDDLVAQIKQMHQTGSQTFQGKNKLGRYGNPQAELNRLLDILEQQRNQIMGDVRGIQPGVTQEDIDLMQKLQAATLAPGLAQISGNAGARGLTGSSIEGVQRGQFAAQTALGSQAQLQNMAFARANQQLNRQQLLFNTLIGTTTPALDVSGHGVDQMNANKPQGGGWMQRLARGAIGAGLGFATGGPAGAGIGAANGFFGGTQAIPQREPSQPSDPYRYIDPNQPWYGGY